MLLADSFTMCQTANTPAELWQARDLKQLIEESVDTRVELGHESILLQHFRRSQHRAMKPRKKTLDLQRRHKTTKQQPGPKPDLLKIDGDWEEAVKKSLEKKKPAVGWPK
jgi:hypothetical protein